VLVLVLECLDAVKDDELDVIVRLFDNEVDESGRGGLDCGRILGKEGEGGRCFVLDNV
jgi:hypothetical protein